jgi:hypothetical protein
VGPNCPRLARTLPREIVSTICDIFREGRRHWPGGLSAEQYSTLNLIAFCRSGVLGELDCHCNSCGYTKTIPQSCGNRHCPNCLGPRQAKWSARVCKRLPVGNHFHVVFTVPRELAEVMRGNQQVLLGLLFEVVSRTLKKFLKKNWKGEGGFLAVLHTWGQTLQWHPHLHVLISAGCLHHRTGRWRKARPNYLFPVRALAEVYRAIFLRRLEKMDRDETLHWPPHLCCEGSRRCWRRRLANKIWKIFSKPTLKYTRAVVRYLARYTSRAAISNRRILHFDAQEATVRFCYRDNRNDGRREEMTLRAGQFIGRFAQHILPKRFQRSRYYGFLHPTSATSRSDQLPRPDLNPESTDRPKPCPQCGARNWTHLARDASLSGRENASDCCPVRAIASTSGLKSVSLLTARPPPNPSNKPSESRPGRHQPRDRALIPA